MSERGPNRGGASNPGNPFSGIPHIDYYRSIRGNNSIRVFQTAAEIALGIKPGQLGNRLTLALGRGLLKGGLLGVAAELGIQAQGLVVQLDVALIQLGLEKLREHRIEVAAAQIAGELQELPLDGGLAMPPVWGKDP
jgi:hypothetical protein